VSALGQHGDRHLGEVLEIEEGDAVAHGLAEEVLAEVLREERRPEDDQFRACGVGRCAHRVLAAHGAVLASSGQQHDPPHSAIDGLSGEGTEDGGGTGEPGVGGVGQVGSVDAVEYCRPGGGVVPVQGRVGGAGSDPQRPAHRVEAVGYAAPGLAGAAGHQDQFMLVRRRHDDQSIAS